MRFEIDRASTEEPFVFQLLDDADRTLLVGRASATQEECLDLMRETIERLDEPASFEVVEEGGSFFSVVRDGAGEELARSEALGSEAAAAKRGATILDAAAEMVRYEASFTTRVAGEKVSAVGLERIAAGEAPVARLYDFQRASTSGQGGFEELDLDDGTFWFHFNDAEGQALLYSRSFPSAGARAKRIRAIIKAAAREGRYERREEAGAWFFVLKSRNGREIGRSRRFAAAAEMEAAIAYLMETAPRFEERYAPVKRSTEHRDEYNFARASISGAAGFETFEGDDGLHYFHFNDESGRAIFFSQGYTSASGRDNGVRSVIKNAGAGERYYEDQDERGRYFVLKAANNVEIGRSPYFADAGELAAALAFLRTAAPGYAQAWGVELEAPATTRQERFTLEVERDDETPPPVVPFPSGSPPEPPAKVPAEPPAEAPREAAIEPPREPPREPGAETRGKPWWLWLLLLLLLLLLLFLAFRSCRGPRGLTEEERGFLRPATPGSTAEPPAPDPAPPTPSRLRDLDGFEVPDESDESDVPGGLRTPEEVEELEEPEELEESGPPPGDEESIEPPGPDGAALGLPPGSLAWRVAGFLSDPESRFPRTFTMDRVRYPSGSAVLNPEGYQEVDELVEVLRAYPGAKIDLLGHIDGTEDDVYTGQFGDGEITLSAIRGRCIYRKLLERGIAAERMSFRGAGASAPLGGDDTEEGRQRNRRQEIIILER